MLDYLWKSIAFACILLSASLPLTAQQVHEPKVTNAEWSKPYQPFRLQAIYTMLARTILHAISLLQQGKYTY